MSAAQHGETGVWPVRSVEELAVAIQYGYTAKANSEVPGPKYLRITDIQNDSVDWSQVPSCDIEDEDVAKYQLQPGDLVFARTGATVGKSYLIRSGAPESVFASYLIRIRFGGDVDPRYVAYFFRSPSYWRQISESQAGIGQPNVNGTKLAQVRLPVAPIGIQRRIVAEIEKQFSRLDEAVANLKRVKANLDRYLTSTLQSAISGDLVTRTATWRQVALAEVADVIDPQPSHRTPPAHAGGVPYVGLGDIAADEEINFGAARRVSPSVLSEQRQRYVLRNGDFVFGKIGTIGRPARLRPPFDYALSANLVLIQPKERQLWPTYGFYLMASPQIAKLSAAAASATTQAAFGIKRIRRIVVQLPPLNEQQAASAEVDRRLSIVREVETEIDANLKRADALRQSVLVAAFGRQSFNDLGLLPSGVG